MLMSYDKAVFVGRLQIKTTLWYECIFIKVNEPEPPEHFCIVRGFTVPHMTAVSECFTFYSTRLSRFASGECFGQPSAAVWLQTPVPALFLSAD